MRAIGSIQHTDQEADYYGGVERPSDRATFGVYQYCTFDDPSSGLTFVGKPHSFWWSKLDQEFQVEMQPFPFVPKERRILQNQNPEDGSPPLIEVYATHGDMLELPASCLRDRMRGKVVYIPPTVHDDQIKAFVANASDEYSDSDSETADDEDDSEDPQDDCSHLFYKFEKKPLEEPKVDEHHEISDRPVEILLTFRDAATAALWDQSTESTGERRTRRLTTAFERNFDVKATDYGYERRFVHSDSLSI